MSGNDNDDRESETIGAQGTEAAAGSRDAFLENYRRALDAAEQSIIDSMAVVKMQIEKGNAQMAEMKQRQAAVLVENARPHAVGGTGGEASAKESGEIGHAYDDAILLAEAQMLTELNAVRSQMSEVLSQVSSAQDAAVRASEAAFETYSSVPKSEAAENGELSGDRQRTIKRRSSDYLSSIQEGISAVNRAVYGNGDQLPETDQPTMPKNVSVEESDALLSAVVKRPHSEG